MIETIRNSGFIPDLRGQLSQTQIESLRSLLTWTHVELNAFAVAQVFKINFRREARAMKKHLVAPIVGRDETEAFVFDNFLDRSGHWNPPRRASYKVEVTTRAPYVKEDSFFAMRGRRVLKAVTLKEIEKIFAVIEPMGISREAVVIPLRTENPGRVIIDKNGKLEIVVDRDADFDEWIKSLGGRIRYVMNIEDDPDDIA
jgi:hypothetical protein